MNKTYALILALCAAPLAACGDKSADEKANAGPLTEDQVSSESQKLIKPKPGQYSSTTKVTNFEVPGVPEAQAQQMKQMFAGVGGQEQSYCLTEAQAAKGFEETIRKMGEGEDGMKCRHDRLAVNGEKIDAKLMCDAGPRGTATMTITGTVAEESMNLQTNIAQVSDQIPGGKMNIGMSVITKRTGDCTAASRKEAEQAEQAAAAAQGAAKGSK